VSASRFETFGQTIAEAMLSGKPVIATSAGAIPELLDNGQRGILVKPGDSAAFAQEIIRLADDRELCKELGLKGMQKISAENSPAHAIQERLALYRNILDESKNKFAQ
jgi:glycosyltransferase involved in cell wall biosynthesis